jgi:hypothetical protein
MYFPDLNMYSYGRAEPRSAVVNVGWLGGGNTFPVGDTDEAFLQALRCLVAQPVNLYRGYHKCEFCPDSPPELRNGFRWNTNPPEVLGNGEIRVTSNGITYVAPVLIRHYVEVHQYKPPTAFIEACLAAVVQAGGA